MQIFQSSVSQPLPSDHHLLSPHRYGDQALFMRKDIFEALGNFQNIPLMEDYELVKLVHRVFPSSQRRHDNTSLKICDVVVLSEKVQTSARRWREKGVLTTTIMNQVPLSSPLLSSHVVVSLDCVVWSCCGCAS